MASRVIKEVDYWPDKDILGLSLEPNTEEIMAGNEHDFFIQYDMKTEKRIVGFEVWDFAEYFIPRLYMDGAIPKKILRMRFDVQGTPLKNVDIRQVLEWAYHKLVLKRELEEVAAS